MIFERNLSKIDGIKINDDQVVIDLGSFLTSAEQRKLLDLIQSVEIRTESGKMILDVKVEVKE